MARPPDVIHGNTRSEPILYWLRKHETAFGMANKPKIREN
jgi:hypothetical protein